MSPETRNCQNCKLDFTIEPEDFLFYEKIKVPPPTFCPECSHQRRFAWRNTHALYHRPDSISGKNVISIYHPDTKMNIVDQKYWWSDEWDPLDYGIEFDFSRTFFEQWKELRDTIPFQSLSNSKAVNSDYCNVAEESSDCYLISASWKNERVMYSDSIVKIKDSLDLYVVEDSEFCYECTYCKESYQLFYSQECIACTDSYFLYDCKGCINCFMSSGLRNRSYVFKNIQYSKEEYFKKIGEYSLESFETIKRLKTEFNDLKHNTIRKFAITTNSHEVSGNHIDNAFNCKNVFDVSHSVKNCKDLYWCVNNIFDCRYCNAIGAMENAFEMNDAGVGGSFCRFSSVVYSSHEVSYSFNCYNCHDIFGCIGLKNKSFCILNKQYTKEEYFELVEKIKMHMMDVPYIDKKGRVYTYGEFFPIELSPFAYNETVANDFYPLDKDEILNQGFFYRNKEQKEYTPTKSFSQIPDKISDVDDTILSDIIECDTYSTLGRCTRAFKIVPEELSFYKRFNIPVPRKCYQCRHKERFDTRNPLKLWHRSCMCEEGSHGHEGKCASEFETSYAPERPEKIYCEGCYQKEVL
jgi:hypothetical protein